MTTEQKLDRIKAKCEEIIRLGEKRTQGRWRCGASNTIWTDGYPPIAQVSLSNGMPDQMRDSNAAFIAILAGPAEANARCTIAAIDGLITELDERAGYTIDDILSAWPDELL